MPSQYTINQIIQFYQISQYLAANDKSSQTQLQSGSFVGILPKLLYMEGTLLQNLNSLNPSSSTLRGTAEYVLSLCGKYLQQAITIRNNIAGSLPVITGPPNESVNVGQTATFSISVTSATPVTYQWFLNNVLIPGATSSSYLVTNAQLSQSGGLYSVAATNASGTVVSNQATLTVTAAILGFFYQGNTDYSNALAMGTDSVPYSGTFNITTGQPFTVTFPNIGATQFIVLKYPITEPTKSHYINPPPSGLDSGAIPSIAWRETIIGSWKYIYSANGSPFALNGTTGQIQFS